MCAAPARSWSSRTIPKCANSSSSSSRTRAIAWQRRLTASRRWNWSTRGTIRPDLILADYNLPNGMNGLQVAAKLREKLHRQIPVIILTGDISTDTLRDIARQDCVQLNKPVKLKELTQVIQRLLPISQSAAHPHAPHPAEAASSPAAARHLRRRRRQPHTRGDSRACSRKMAGPSRIMRLARHSSKPIVRAAKHAS